jgi:hypothetical protein
LKAHKEVKCLFFYYQLLIKIYFEKDFLYYVNKGSVNMKKIGRFLLLSFSFVFICLLFSFGEKVEAKRNVLSVYFVAESTEGDIEIESEVKI